jgi:predicted RNA-binding protein with PIN domain
MHAVAKFLIVDAHSVIFAWPELRALHTRRMVLARDALVKLLTEYQDFTGTRVVAVFDGQGGKSSDVSEPGGIQIFYSAAHQTADDLVERLVAKYGKIHEITVATSDTLEQDTVTSFGGICVSALMLKAMIEETQGNLQRELKQRKRS